MKVLVTGAFGNVGQSTIKALIEKKYKIRCLDIKTKRNMKTAKKIRKKYAQMEVIWGDIRDTSIVEEAVNGVQSIIHLAAIIPPLSEIKPDFAYSVNVEGSMNLIKAAMKQEPKPRFIFTSSVSVYGRKMHMPPPRKVTDILNPIEYYGEHKITIEKELQKTQLSWTILRLGAVTPNYVPWSIPPMMFDIPLDQRIEVVHTLDVGIACANAVTAPVERKILHIGGGPKCQMLERDFLMKMFDGMGLGMLPEEAFKIPNSNDDWYHLDWMDTKEAEELLQFQKHTLEDFIIEFKKTIRFQRFLIKTFKPIVKSIMLSKSPYYATYKKLKRRRKTHPLASQINTSKTKT
ncbi:MAG: NAD-dependent epimerase/dehydratase family protein [Candidatus Heimdallarchaeaceae archaeon]